MTFNKFNTDFEFSVNLNNLEHLNAKELEYLVGYNLTHSLVKGVAEAFEKNTGEKIEPKGIKAHFNMDDSGLLTVESTEAVFEKNFTVEMQIQAEKDKLVKDEADAKTKEADETWAKLGDKISSLWGESEGEKKEGEPDEKDAEKDSKKEKKKDEKKDAKKESKKDKKPKKEEPKKPIITILKEPLAIDIEMKDIEDLTDEQKSESYNKLKAWTDHDNALMERATCFNDLESFVIDIQAKLWEDLYEKSSTEEEREKIRAKCSEISDWLYDDYTEETEVKVLKDKLKEIKELTSGLTTRVREQHDRPEAMTALKSMLNTSTHFYSKAVNSTSVVDGFFSQEELDALGKHLEGTKEWITKSEKTIEEEPMHQMPSVTASKIAEQGIALDREVKFLVNKAKIAKRKAAEEAAEKAAKEKAAKEKAAKANKKKNATEEADKSEDTMKDDTVTVEGSAAEDVEVPVEAESTEEGSAAEDLEPLEEVTEEPLDEDLRDEL